MSYQDDSVSLEIVPCPEVLRQLRWDRDRISCAGIVRVNARLENKFTASRPEDTVCDTEAGYNGEDPTQGVARVHKDRDLLHGEDKSCADRAKHKVQKQRHDLSIYVRLEEEGADISEGHHSRWEKQKHYPDTLVEAAEDEHEQDH